MHFFEQADILEPSYSLCKLHSEWHHFNTRTIERFSVVRRLFSHLTTTVSNTAV